MHDKLQQFGLNLLEFRSSMRKIFAVLGLFIFSHFVAKAQHEDTILMARNTDLLKNLLRREGNIHPFYVSSQSILQTTYKHSQQRAQYVIKTPKNLFVLIDWTGILYKAVHFTDSLITFKRIDSTINLNYNSGGPVYVHQEEIHVFGGYSFWKTNGTDKKFNEKDMQWDVVPLSEEIIPQLYPRPLFWHDIKNEFVWLPYQRILNAGIKDPDYLEGKIIPYVYRLNLKTKDWEKVGSTNPELVEILKKSGLYVETEKGILLSDDRCLYKLDFENNKVFKLNDFSMLQSFLRRSYTDFRYVYHDTLFYFNSEKNKYDSLWLDPKKFEVMDIPIFQKESSYNKYFIGLAMVVLTSVIVYLILQQKKKSDETPQQIDNQWERQIDKKSTNEFTDIEQRLIALLKQKSLLNETATPTEINYVLGVKDKNVGLQKKVRSDVINSINEKYKQITGSGDSLILSIRNENDKRHLEYFIDPDSVPI
jgi:hypothetical protein